MTGTELSSSTCLHPVYKDVYALSERDNAPTLFFLLNTKIHLIHLLFKFLGNLKQLYWSLLALWHAHFLLFIHWIYPKSRTSNKPAQQIAPAQFTQGCLQTWGCHFPYIVAPSCAPQCWSWNSRWRESLKKLESHTTGCHWNVFFLNTLLLCVIS